MRVYPSPVELLVIFQKTIPPSIFQLVVEMTQVDVSQPTAPPNRRTAMTDDDGVDSEPDSGQGSVPRTGPPSETSSHEWDKLSDPGPIS
jgi:mitochondrial import receptor subunit TOM20